MRINQFVARASGLSRRAADKALADGRITVNGEYAIAGYRVRPNDHVALDARVIVPPVDTTTIMLNKPVGYVCSRDGQGSKTIYGLLPTNLHHLKPVGRLDKDSSGLLLLTNNGGLAHNLTHPSYQKQKIYEVELHKSLTTLDQKTISGDGVMLDDGVSSFALEPMREGTAHTWKITMSEGRNRQIRRTFNELNYRVVRLHRTQFGSYQLEALISGNWREIKNML